MRNPIFWATIVGIVVACLMALYGSWMWKIEASTFLTIAGTVITAVAFAFGTYFAALAVDAYSQIALVRATTDQVSKQAAEVETIFGKVRNSEQQAEDALRNAKSVISKLEDDSFSHLEGVMHAIVAYAQKMPANGKQSSATQELIHSISFIRDAYICTSSKDEQKVSTALLNLSQAAAADRIRIATIAKSRFADTAKICTICDTLLTMDS